MLGSGVNATDYSFAGGPRFNLRPAFVHLLFGVDRLTGSAFGLSASQNSFAMVLGGGVQAKVATHWAVRTSVDYVATHHNVFGGPAVLQNNVRVGVGVVFTSGSRSRQALAAAPVAPPPLPAPVVPPARPQAAAPAAAVKATPGPSPSATAQDAPVEEPLGDVARRYREEKAKREGQ